MLSFSQELVALIDRGNSRNRSCLVVQYFVCNVGSNPEPSHAAHNRPAQIVKHPPTDTGNLVEPLFVRRECLESALAGLTQEVPLPSRKSAENHDHRL